MNKIPRPHQTDTIEKLKQSIISGHKRPIIQLPTGAGKTLIAAMIIEGALKKGNNVMFVVPAISLIDQTVQAFWNEDIRDIGIIQASHPMTNWMASVQVASIQTLMRRELPDVQLVIIDECHKDFKFIRQWMAREEWKNIIFVGLSATPWTKGLGKHYDDLIIGETTQGLIDKKLLVPFRVFAPAHPDLSNVKKVAGDYHEGQLADVMGDKKLVANVVSTWLSKGENRPTFCFAVDCAHAQKLQKEFQESGVNCGYIDAYTPQIERGQLKKSFESGELQVICSVGTMIVGVDWDCRCLIWARPTQSTMLYVQGTGRGLRIKDGKQDCLILDHSDNALRLGFVTDIQVDKLDIGKKSDAEKQKRKIPLPKECPSCTYLKPPKVHKCPSCGFEPTKQSDISEGTGELQEVKGKRKYTMQEKQKWYSGLLYISKERGYSKGWASHTYREKFSVWPNSLSEVSIYPDVEVSHFVTAKLIRFKKQKVVNG